MKALIKQSRARLARALGHLDRDEQATTLTEFIIILPAFILIFAASLQLSKLHHLSVEAQISATRTMWEGALDVTQDATPSSTHLNVGNAASDAQNKLSNRTKFKPVHAFNNTRWNALQNQGTMGESQQMVQALVNNGHVSPSLGLANYELLFKNEPDYNNQDNYSITANLSTVANTRYSNLLLDDRTPNNPTPTISPSSPFGNVSGHLSSLGNTTTLSNAAGVRYGMAYGENDNAQTYTSFGVPIEIKAGFDTLVAPYPHIRPEDQARTTGMTRLTMQRNDAKLNHFNTLLGFERAENLTFSNSISQ